MGRLIDADEVKAKMESTLDMQDLYLPYHFHNILDETPTVDAVPVVRCKDCKFSRPFTEEELEAEYRVGEWHCAFWYAEMHEDDYCSCGKRRKDETD